MSRLQSLLVLFQLCILNLAAPLPSTPLSLINGHTSYLELPKNLSLHSHPTCGYLPTDPFSTRVSGSEITVVFRNYTIAIPRSYSWECVKAALGDAVTHEDRLYRRIQTPREYAYGSVELTLVPGQKMLWIHWWYTVSAISKWVTSCDSVDMNFDIQVAEKEIVGTGRLAGII